MLDYPAVLEKEALGAERKRTKKELPKDLRRRTLVGLLEDFSLCQRHGKCCLVEAPERRRDPMQIGAPIPIPMVQVSSAVRDSEAMPCRVHPANRARTIDGDDCEVTALEGFHVEPWFDEVPCHARAPFNERATSEETD